MDLSTTTLILTGLVTIVFLVAVIFSYKTWKVYTILLVLLNFMAAVCFFYYAVRTLKTHKEWRETAAIYEAGLKRVEKENRELVEGTRDADDKLVKAGIKWNKRWLHHLALTRGRVWEGCQPGTVDASTGAVAVTVPAGGDHVEIESPTEPGGAGKGEIVYVFEKADVETGGRYIGEFNVLKKTSGDSGVVFDLVPTRKVQGVELTRITDKKGPWLLHAVMPRDSHRAFSRLSLKGGKAEFTTLDEERLRELAPKRAAGENDAEYQKFVDAWVDEYSRDMQTARPDDPPARKWVRVSFKQIHELNKIASHPRLPLAQAGTVEIVPGENYGDGLLLDYKTFKELGPDVVSQEGEIYVRELRDYEHLYHDYDRERVSIVAEIVDIQRERNYVLASQIKVLAREAMRVRERDLLKADAANFVVELTGVTAYAARLDQHGKDILVEIKRLHFENQALAKELAQLQLAAKRRLEGRSPEKSTSLPKKAAYGL